MFSSLATGRLSYLLFRCSWLTSVGGTRLGRKKKIMKKKKKKMMAKVRGNLIPTWGLLQPCTIMCVHSGPLGLMATHTRSNRDEFCSLLIKKKTWTTPKAAVQIIKICTYCLSQKSCLKRLAHPFSSTKVTLGCLPFVQLIIHQLSMTKATLGCPLFGTTSLGQAVT